MARYSQSRPARRGCSTGLLSVAIALDVLTGASPLLADLDRPEGAVYVAIYLGEIERGAVAVVKVAETKEMETDKIQFVKASEYDVAADRLTSEGIGREPACRHQRHGRGKGEEPPLRSDGDWSKAWAPSRPARAPR